MRPNIKEIISQMKRIQNLRNLLLTAFAVVMVAFSMNAQKFGHLNSTDLMSDLPAIKAADVELQTFQEQLNKTGQDMYSKFEVNYNNYLQKTNEGSLSQLQAQEIEASLSQEQQAIQAYQQEVQSKMYIKREQLYAPIFAKLTTVIEEYGKTNGYTMIFDVSLGAILFEDSEDLTAAIKAKL